MESFQSGIGSFIVMMIITVTEINVTHCLPSSVTSMPWETCNGFILYSRWISILRWIYATSGHFCWVLLSVLFVTVTPVPEPLCFFSLVSFSQAWPLCFGLIVMVLMMNLALLNIVSVGLLWSSSLATSQISPWSLIPCLCVWLLLFCLRSRLHHLSSLQSNCHSPWPVKS